MKPFLNRSKYVIGLLLAMVLVISSLIVATSIKVNAVATCPAGYVHNPSGTTPPCVDDERFDPGGNPEFDEEGNPQTEGPAASLPGCAGAANSAGANCSEIPAGCPGSGSRYQTADPNSNPQCPFEPTATAEWVCRTKTCIMPSGTLQTGQKSSLQTGGGNTEDATDLECDVEPNPLTWVACPVIWMVNGLINSLDNAIIGLLTIEQDKIFNANAQPGKGYYEAWQTFRAIALGILVIGALIMIISQALGFDFLDAYTIKKILPRLLVAIIGIALSWEIMRWFVVLTNDFGLGIRQLIYYPFLQGGVGSPETTAMTGGNIVVLLTAGGMLGLGLLGLLSFGATALLALLIAFFVLVLRQLIIVVLILSAPIAIAAYILPNTQSIWKLWYESFTKALMMFPIIMAFLAVGRVISMTSSNDQASVVGHVIAFVAYILPYFLIPLTFRFAGGALATLGGFVNDRGRGGFDRLKKYRQGQYREHGGRKVEAGQRRVLQKRAALADYAKNKASIVNPVTGRPSRLRKMAYGGLAGAAGGYNVEAEMSRKRAEVGKELNEQIATGRDEEIRGLTVDKSTATLANGRMRVNSDGQRQFKSLAGAWINEGDVDQAQSRWGKDTFAQQAALSYEMRKASSEEEVQAVASGYRNVAKNAWKMSDGEAQGAWIGSSFENQSAHLEYKKTNWRTGRMTDDNGNFDIGKAAGFVDEIYEKKGSYPLAQMGSNTIEELRKTHQEAGRIIASGSGTRAQIAQAQETQRKVQAVAESFVSRYGGGGGVVGMADGDVPIAGAPSGSAVQTNTPGAAHVAERVRQLAVDTGVYQAPHPLTDVRPSGPPPTIPRQN